jgi:ion channel POLLUX/CASTOR
MSPLRFMDRVKFFVERQFLKGAGFQLLFVGFLIALLSTVGGLLVAPFGEPFENVGAAVWWAFLRLTDPGYLGDDEGTWRRLVSTFLTVSSYVVFLGALVAIMTRWLIAKMTDLERGLTPVTLKRHIVVLGWTSRTLPLLTDLLRSSGRMRRFLERNDTSKLQLVVLSETVSAAKLLELQNEPGIGRRARQVILRSGTPIQPDALHRVACLDAAVVIVPSGSQGRSSLVTSDVETVKALLSIAAQARQNQAPLPYVVAEIQDLRKRPVIERAYPGAVEVVAGDVTISRLMAQNILHPGLSEIYNELLTAGEGNGIYVRSGEAMGELTLEALAAQCPQAIVLGMLRPSAAGWTVELLADSAKKVYVEDRVVMLARDYADTQPNRTAERLPLIQRKAPRKTELKAEAETHRVLVLGWNRRVPSLIAEFGSYSQHRFNVDVVSVVPAADRNAEVQEYAGDLPNVQCRHINADYMVEGELRRLNPHTYDSILLLSNDRLASGEEADARAMLGYLQLDEILAREARRPQLIMEISDPDNGSLLTVNQTEMLIRPMILSHMLAQVALRRELGAVFEELFTAGGVEFSFRSAADYLADLDVDFHTLEKAVAVRGEIALGVYRKHPADGGHPLELNPDREANLKLEQEDLVVVLADTVNTLPAHFEAPVNT